MTDEKLKEAIEFIELKLKDLKEFEYDLLDKLPDTATKQAMLEAQNENYKHTKKALYDLISFANQYFSISEQCPKENNITEAEKELECDSVELNKMIGYNAGRKDMIMWVMKRVNTERTERIIAEFIPHKDSQYVKPLAEAICAEILGKQNAI